MKRCPACEQTKPVDAFHFDSSKRGPASYCKLCAKARLAKRYTERKAEVAVASRAYYEANREQIAQTRKQWVAKNLNKVREYQRGYAEANRPAIRGHKEKWRVSNPQKLAAKEARRRVTKAQATPAWADHTDMAMWREVAQVLSRGGVLFHVDHIVPLKSRIVCGLHVQDNLTVIRPLTRIGPRATASGPTCRKARSWSDTSRKPETIWITKS